MKLIAALLLFSSSSWAATTAYFADSCSGEEIKIATPNGTSLKVEIDGLDPKEDLTLFIKFRPAGIIEDLKDKPSTVTHNYFIKAHDFRNGRFADFFALPKAKWLWQVEMKHSQYRIWDAEVFWIQKGIKKSESVVTTFYRSQEQKEFYQINSPGLCQWETEIEVDSKLYENNSTGFMNVMRESTQMWDKYDVKGLSLGFNRNHGGVLPIGALSSSSHGWLFKDWQKQMNTQEMITLERKYVLNKEESGVFINRMSYNRHEVTKFRWNPHASYCGRYEKETTGFLDVGVPVEDFVVLPKYIFPREEYLKEFLDVVRPAVDTCNPNLKLRPEIATELIPSGITGILYFYETNGSSL